jgi:putative CocE/NonD family hydrolase
VIDEDGDGQIADEIPLDLNGNGWFSDDYRWPLESGPAPKYADGVARTHHYYLSAVMQHVADPAGAPGTFDGDPVFSAMKFWDTKRPGDGLTAPDLDWAWLPDVMKSGVAVLNLAGWFDAFVEGTFQVYGTIHRATPSRLIARPMYHQGVSQAFASSIGVTTAAGQLPMEDRIEELRWFDRWLKGIRNGVDREPAVRYFVMNDGWRTSPTWPPPKAAPTRMYLAGSKSLARAKAPAARSDGFTADFSQYSAWPPLLPAGPIAEVDSLSGRPSPGIAAFRRNRQFMFGVPEGPPVRTELDRRGLSYTTAPLDHDTDVIGHPIVHLWASSTAADGDFYFYLEDVDPSGRAVQVTEYQHRAGFSRLVNQDLVIPGHRGIHVEPALPWHGYRAADYDPKVFAGGKVAEVVTALYPTAWRFKRGHSIRLSIAAADWPTFELHPALAPSNRPDAAGNVVPTVTVHWGGVRGSYLQLPIVPRP